MLLPIFLVLGTFIFMEGFAWFAHKYIMHGPMWNWHESHHVHHKGWWETNDLFGIIFGVSATALIVIGSEVETLRWLMYIGFGITLYGIAYFIVSRRDCASSNQNQIQNQQPLFTAYHSGALCTP
jgi:beta-carotene 3-hydroxylase